MPDGRVASGADDGSVRVWDPQGRHEAQVFLGHMSGIRALAVLTNGRIASGAANGSVRIWELHGRHEAQVLTGHTGGIRVLAVLPKGYMASALAIARYASGTHCQESNWRYSSPMDRNYRGARTAG